MNKSFPESLGDIVFCFPCYTSLCTTLSMKRDFMVTGTLCISLDELVIMGQWLYRQRKVLVLGM